MIGDDLDTPPLKYSPIRYLGLPLFVRILPYFLSSCRPEYRWRNWLLACAHVGLVDVGGVGAGQRFAVHVPPEKEPTPIKYDSSSEQMWRRPLGAPPPAPHASGSLPWLGRLGPCPREDVPLTGCSPTGRVCADQAPIVFCFSACLGE